MSYHEIRPVEVFEESVDDILNGGSILDMLVADAMDLRRDERNGDLRLDQLIDPLDLHESPFSGDLSENPGELDDVRLIFKGSGTVGEPGGLRIEYECFHRLIGKDVEMDLVEPLIVV